jgi:hypothetical protein
MSRIVVTQRRHYRGTRMPIDPQEPIEPSPLKGASRVKRGPGSPWFVPPREPPDPSAGRAGSPRARAPLPSTATPRAWLAGVIAGAIALTCYAWGAAPTVLSGDSAEMATVAAVGGVPHPTGYPTFVLIGQATKPFLPGNPARRVTLMCALMGGVSRCCCSRCCCPSSSCRGPPCSREP